MQLLELFIYGLSQPIETMSDVLLFLATLTPVIFVVMVLLGLTIHGIKKLY